MEISKLEEMVWRIKKEGRMKEDALIIASQKLIEKIKADRTLWQLCNVASLPVAGKPAVMPDGHEGYGFPIGGVAAFDIDGGVVSPGGIGYDINCGVRLLLLPVSAEEIRKKAKEFVEVLFAAIPSGVGSEGKLRLGAGEMEQVMEMGAEWGVENGFGEKEDLNKIEEGGKMQGAEPKNVSAQASKRGKNQLGTLGAGNHFIEVQEIETVMDEKVAERFGLKKGMATIMVHTGSRGFGHQVCSDYLVEMMKAVRRRGIELPDRELVYAPLDEPEAQRYLGAMKAAVNFAFANRQIIAGLAREAFYKVFGDGGDIPLLYDVAHNIAKEEEHIVDGKKRKLLVHRKGATRAFPKGRPELPSIYKEVGQPVIIPGSMGTASYVLVGQERGLELSFGSSCHGSGRAMSRSKAIEVHRGRNIAGELARAGIYLRAVDQRLIAEEAPGAYKDVDEVVRSVVGAGISKAVARLKPILVVKG
ncbi:MAG: RtcB family protein [Candidatus Anstonellales archaeon]